MPRPDRSNLCDFCESDVRDCTCELRCASCGYAMGNASDGDVITCPCCEAVICQCCGSPTTGNAKDGYRCTNAHCPARAEYDAMQAPDTYCAECAFDRTEGPCVCDSHRSGYHNGAPVDSCPLCPVVHFPASPVETLAIRPGAIRGAGSFCACGAFLNAAYTRDQRAEGVPPTCPACVAVVLS